MSTHCINRLVIIFLYLILVQPAANALDTPLAAIATKLKPGHWVELKTTREPRLMNVFVGHKKSGKLKYHHIAGWTDDAHWDSDRGQFFFMGYRKHLKFITYEEQSNHWRVLPGPFGWPTQQGGFFKDNRKTKYGHTYGGNAYDARTKTFYCTLAGYTYIYSVEKETWKRVAGGSKMSIEYFPEIGLLSHQRKPNKNGKFQISKLNQKLGTWEYFTELSFSGQQALMRYNQKLKEMLVIAGKNNRSVVSISKSGKITKLKETPFDITIRHGRLLVDPQTSHYLLFNNDQLHEFDSKSNQYKQVNTYKPPWTRHEMPVPAAIPEHGVLMFIDRKTYIYKHKASIPTQ